VEKAVKFLTENEIGLQVIETKRHFDDRGWFEELFNQHSTPFCFPIGVRQISRAYSKKNVIRGMHFQYAIQMPKMIHVLQGEINLYAVDLRYNSESTGLYVGVNMNNADTDAKLFVPHYCAVGYEVLSTKAVIEYFHGGSHNAETAMTIRWDDPAIGIPWSVKNPIMSEKDATCSTYICDWLMSPFAESLR
jgi:dTDP-4-dehydrorhamnose 3,5-epimerase